MPDHRVLIVGSGLAGAATAWQLALRGIRDVVILEKDPAPGQQASGRNAGMIRTLVADPTIQALALDSARTLARPPEELGTTPFFHPSGSVVLASGDDVGRLRAAAVRSREAGREVREETATPDGPGELLGGVECQAAFHSPEDGVADSSTLLAAFLAASRDGGAALRTGVCVEELVLEEGRVVGVRTNRGPIGAETVVNAAGAWAGVVGRPGAAAKIGIEPRRRHLFSTAPTADSHPDLPFVWHDSSGFYFRPESGGFLLSGCDESPHPATEPVLDPAAEEKLAAKLVRVAPALADLSVRSHWACLRTFARDNLPVIGWDPVRPGLFWVAGLGGHGVTISAAIGALAAEGITAGLDDTPDTPFSPARFL